MKIKNTTNQALAWGLVWKDPKGFLISIIFRGATSVLTNFSLSRLSAWPREGWVKIYNAKMVLDREATVDEQARGWLMIAVVGSSHRSSSGYWAQAVNSWTPAGQLGAVPQGHIHISSITRFWAGSWNIWGGLCVHYTQLCGTGDSSISADMHQISEQAGLLWNRLHSSFMFINKWAVGSAPGANSHQETTFLPRKFLNIWGGMCVHYTQLCGDSSISADKS